MGRFEKTGDYKVQKKKKGLSHITVDKDPTYVQCIPERRKPRQQNNKDKRKKKPLQVKKSVLMLRQKGEWRGPKTTY